jgi:hypothetical protein
MYAEKMYAYETMDANETNGEEMLSVLYNTCYGGWHPSQCAMDIYNTRMKASNPAFKEVSDHEIDRHDTVLVQIYHELGNTFDAANYSQTAIMAIPMKYKYYYRIEEQDGLECVVVDIDKWALVELKNQIKQLLDRNLPDAEKIADIYSLIA